MELIRDTIERFKQSFHSEPEFVVTAPGRVNLLGEHTDYNDGFVLPVAIDRNIIVAIGHRDDSEIHLHAIDLLKTVRTSVNDLVYDSKNIWVNYPVGVLKLMESNGVRIRGMNICYRGTIPMGAGLSSSAAIEVAVAVAVSRLYNNSFSPLELIRLAQKVEVEFVGVNCGIMDQFVSVLGLKHHAIFLDCRSLQHEYIPCPQGIRLMVCDTGVGRELALSAYNQRRTECLQAVEHFATYNPAITALRDISIEEFVQHEEELPPVIRKRARHVILENARVQRGVDALRRGDVTEFGKLMIDSHMSLRDLFDVSCKELDAFVDVAIEAEGVYGARMTGAGFGGCGICLLKESHLDAVVEHLRREYPRIAGRSLTIYIASVEQGAMIFDLKELHAPERFAG